MSSDRGGTGRAFLVAMVTTQGRLNQVRGMQAEEEALRWLSAKPGLRLLARNYRCKGGEIDLVLEETVPGGGRELVFVEVRSRVGESWACALESVTRGKRRKLARAIRYFLEGYRGGAKTLRVDVLARDGRAWTLCRNIRMDE